METILSNKNISGCGLVIVLGGLSKVVRAVYKDSVLQLLEPVDLEEGEEVLVTIKRDIRKVLKKYWGILGRSSIRELLEIEEEVHIQ